MADILVWDWKRQIDLDALTTILERYDISSRIVEAGSGLYEFHIWEGKG